MTDVGYLGALLGGVLALISPCSALLLPSFFAVAFQSPGRVVSRTALFTIGLMITLVPLGVGSTFISRLFIERRELLITISGWAIIIFGVMQILGFGFASSTAQRAMNRVTEQGSEIGKLSTVALGAVYGLAGFCSGPILGSVLAIASLSGRPVYGGLLLAMYALGMAIPLFILALGWQHWDIGSRHWLRGRTFTVFGRQLHTTSVISGVVFVAIGVLFLWFDGTAGLTSPIDYSTQAELQEWIQRNASPGTDTLVLVGVAVVALAWYLWRRRSAQNSES